MLNSKRLRQLLKRAFCSILRSKNQRSRKLAYMISYWLLQVSTWQKMITLLGISKKRASKDVINRKIKSVLLNSDFTVLMAINSDYKNNNVYTAGYNCYHNYGKLKLLSDNNCLICYHSKPTNYSKVTLKTSIRDNVHLSQDKVSISSML